MDNIAHLPLAYQCAVETLNNGERTASRLRGLVDHFEVSTGLQASPDMARHLQGWRDAAQRIAARRYWDFNSEA